MRIIQDGLNTINAHLAEKGLLLREGTIVDATLIAAPPSTKNREGKRDEEMHQTKKGNQWHFGMKAHIGPQKQVLAGKSGLFPNQISLAHLSLRGKVNYSAFP